MAEPSETARSARIDECRRRFRESGLPLFDEDFSASENVFNRAAPLLVLWFIVQMFVVSNPDWSTAGNAAAVAGAMLIALTVGALINRWRGRPWKSMPRHVGRVELAVFVLVPALLVLAAGEQVRDAIETALLNAAVLLLVYAVLAYGLPSILLWIARRLWRQLMASFMLLARAVPLLMIFALLAFMSDEMWQVFSRISYPDLAAVGLLFVGLGTAFLFARLPKEVRLLEEQVGTEDTPLDKRQRRNVSVVLFASQAVQVLAVSLLVAAFFILFGGLAINEEVRKVWIDGAGDVLVQFELIGEPFQITAELLKVAGGLAAFTGLYFAIAMLTDSTYREEFLDEVTGELRSVFAVREEYLRLRAEG